MVEVIVSVTKKGQATIPKKLRKKYGITNKVLMIEDDEKGILLKPIPDPAEAFGSLKHLFPGKLREKSLKRAEKRIINEISGC